MNELQILNIEGIDCYEKEGVVYLRLDNVARGLGFTKTETKNGAEYTTIRWERVFSLLDEIGFDHKWAKDCFIPENVFYRLAMKAKNAVAEAFQAKIADVVIPSIRRNGGYIAGQDNMTPEELMAAALLVANKTIENQKARLSQLTVQNQIMAPKADYFDQLVDRNLLTNFRETAKQLEVRERDFVHFLINNKYIYRDKRGKLMPYAQHAENGLFEVKECFNEKTEWKGTQTLVTPKGRETFRLLFIGAK